MAIACWSWALLATAFLQGGEAKTAPPPLADHPAFLELLKKADRNKDGQLDNLERAAMARQLDDFLKKELATKADVNGDGQLSVSERLTLKSLIDKRRLDLLKGIPGGGRPTGSTTVQPLSGQDKSLLEKELREKLQQGQGFNNPNPNANPLGPGGVRPGQGSSFGPGGPRPGQGPPMIPGGSRPGNFGSDKK